MLSAIKLNISNYILNKELNKLKHATKLVPLSKLKRLAILFDANDNQDVVAVKSLLKYFLDKNIDVSILGFVDKKEMDEVHLSTLYINYFNLKDTNFLGIPNSKKTHIFLAQKYDMLVNLSLNNSFPPKYLALKSKSKFKVVFFCFFVV